MSNKNESAILFISLVITLGIFGLLGGGVWWLTSRNPDSLVKNGQMNPVTSNPSNGKQGINDRLSAGEKLLITTNNDPSKLAGIKAFSEGNYQDAIAQLTASLQTKSNDPETRIYLNNARIGKNDAYNIAVVAPIGTDIDGAQEILRGVAQAQDNINQAGGINGVSLRITIANDDNNPEMATQVATNLAKNLDILGVIGHWGSDASLAAAKVYQDQKLVMISPTSTSTKLSGFGNYILRTVPSDRFTASMLSRYQVNQVKKQKTAIFYNSKSDYSQSLKQEFTTALFGDGGAVVGEFDLSRPDFNAANDWQEAQQKGAEVIMFASDTTTIDQALLVVQVNNGKLTMLGGDSLYKPKTLQIGAKNAIGMVVAIPWHFLANLKTSFSQNAQKMWGGEVSWRTAMAYDATESLISALKANPNPSRNNIQEALTNPNFQAPGASGQINFLPSGDRNQAVQLVKIEAGKRSGFGYDFVPIR